MLKLFDYANAMLAMSTIHARMILQAENLHDDHQSNEITL